MYYRYDIQNLLKSKVTSYVAECFKVAGFDNLSAIKQMSVTGSANSIQCMGHVLAIKTAIMEIQSKYGGSGLHHSKAKRRKVDNTASSKNIEEMAGACVNIPNIKEDIRNRIHKWANDHINARP